MTTHETIRLHRPCAGGATTEKLRQLTRRSASTGLAPVERRLKSYDNSRDDPPPPRRCVACRSYFSPVSQPSTDAGSVRGRTPIPTLTKLSSLGATTGWRERERKVTVEIQVT